VDVICTKVKEAEPTALISSDADKENFDARQILESALKGKCSSKMLAILHEIDTIWQEDPGSKILIFSQYLGMFDLLQKEFARQGIKAFRLDGKMSLNDRRQTVKQFNTSRFLNNGKPRGIILLASMKACGVGMNLTAASSVFIVDPWWNDAMESQCINRIHRIGQTAPIVKVRKFIVSDSVEEKIVKMQHRKQGMANEVLSEESATSKKANPTLDDLKAIFGS
jgi:SNF2 family DNA or RNA helicase